MPCVQFWSSENSLTISPTLLHHSGWGESELPQISCPERTYADVVSGIADHSEASKSA